MSLYKDIKSNLKEADKKPVNWDNQWLPFDRKDYKEIRDNNYHVLYKTNGEQPEGTVSFRGRPGSTSVVTRYRKPNGRIGWVDTNFEGDVSEEDLKQFGNSLNQRGWKETKRRINKGESLEESDETPCEDPVERERRIKEVYLMDRVIRGMNDEDGLYDSGWLYNVADEDSDDGFEEFKERSLKYNGDDPYYEHSEPDYYYTDEEMYKHLVELYKEILKEYGEAGFITRDFYKNSEGNWKDNAGLDDEQIEFLKKDLPDAKLYTEGAK